jgi:hypothetical protein
VLKLKLQQVTQKMQELKLQAHKASEEDKAVDQQIYIAQLKQADAERALLEQELQKQAKATRHLDEDLDLKKSLQQRDEMLAQARKELADLADREKQAEAGLRQADASQEQVEVLRKHLADMTLRYQAEQDRARAVEQELNRRLAELQSQEARLREQQAKSELARRQALEERSAREWKNGRDNAPSRTDSSPGGEVGALGNARLSSGPIDLLALATSYADAVGNVRVARVQAKTGSGRDQRLGQASLEAAERKASLLRGIAEAAFVGADAENKQVRQMVEQGVVPQSALIESEAKLRILKLILSADGGNDGGDDKGDDAKPDKRPDRPKDEAGRQ